MRIVIQSKKPILVPDGRLPIGVPIDVADPLGRFLVQRGDAVVVEHKGVDEQKRRSKTRKPSDGSEEGL